MHPAQARGELISCLYLTYLNTYVQVRTEEQLEQAIADATGVHKHDLCFIEVQESYQLNSLKSATC